MAPANSTRILITGGAGFLGGFIVSALQRQHPDWELSILDVRLPPLDQQIPGIAYHGTDLRDSTTVSAILKSVAPTAIVHTAGIVPGGNARYNGRNYSLVYDVNVNATRHLLAAAKDAGVHAFVFTSSCTVVSDDLTRDYAHMDEAVPIGNATLTYGRTKGIAEELVLEANAPDLFTCALRPHTIIAPNDPVCLPTLYLAMRNGLAPFQMGNGENMYDFVYGPNVADAHVLALENLLQVETSWLHPRKPRPAHVTRSTTDGETNGETIGETNTKIPVVDRFADEEYYVGATNDGMPTAAGEAFFINNAAPIAFRTFMLAVWKEMGHVPSMTVCIPYWLGWTVGAVVDVWDWISRGWVPEGVLSRGLIGDAVHTMYSNGEKARRILGYSPRVPFNEAVKMSVRGFMEKKSGEAKKA